MHPWSRDTCCGTLGYPLYSQLRGLADSTGGALRVWQATHFQFHRFAPVVWTCRRPGSGRG